MTLSVDQARTLKKLQAALDKKNPYLIELALRACDAEPPLRETAARTRAALAEVRHAAYVEHWAAPTRGRFKPYGRGAIAIR